MWVPAVSFSKKKNGKSYAQGSSLFPLPPQLYCSYLSSWWFLFSLKEDGLSRYVNTCFAANDCPFPATPEVI